MTRKPTTAVSAGVAGASAAAPVGPSVRDDRAFLAGQVERMERKVERARAALAAAEAALIDARSQLAAFSGDADG